MVTSGLDGLLHLRQTGGDEIDRLLLGLDVGTTAIKAAVVDEAGRELSHGRATTPWRQVPTGAELDPDALLRRRARSGASRRCGGQTVVGDRRREHGRDRRADRRRAAPRRPVDRLVRHARRRGGGADRGRVAGLRRAHRPAAERDVHAREVRLDAPPLAGRRARARAGSTSPSGSCSASAASPAPEASLASRTGFYDLHTGTRVGAGAWRWADAPATLAPPTRRRARRSAARARPAARLRRRGCPAPRARCSRSAATTTRRPRSARARRARATCSTPAAPPRRSCARPPRWTPRPSAAPSPTASPSAATPSPAATSSRARSGPARRLQAVKDRYGEDSPEYRAALEEAGAHRRGHPRPHGGARRARGAGWSSPAAGRKAPPPARSRRRHLGPFEHVAEGYAGCRGAALRAAASLGS